MAAGTYQWSYNMIAVKVENNFNKASSRILLIYMKKKGTTPFDYYMHAHKHARKCVFVCT